MAWGVTALAVMLAVIVSARGLGILGAESLIRWTARASLLFFAASFVGPGLPAATWLARHQRDLFLTFAVSHLFHAGAVGLLAGLTDGENLAARGPVVVAGGGVGYAAIAIAAVRPGSPLAQWGVYWIWTVFFLAYLPRALGKPPVFGPAIALLLVALVFRVRQARTFRTGSP